MPFERKCIQTKSRLILHLFTKDFVLDFRRNPPFSFFHRAQPRKPFWKALFRKLRKASATGIKSITTRYCPLLSSFLTFLRMGLGRRKFAFFPSCIGFLFLIARRRPVRFLWKSQIPPRPLLAWPKRWLFNELFFTPILWKCFLFCLYTKPDQHLADWLIAQMLSTATKN